MKKTVNGRATLHRRGDVTTVRIVDYHGQPVTASRDLSAGLPSPPPDLETLKNVDILGFNSAAERAFLAMLSALCEKMPDGVPVVGARAEVAFRLNVSTETSKRYIEKYCLAFSAPFFIRDGLIYRKDVSNG